MKTQKFAESFNKIKIAEIQINTSIEMLFENKHPVSIHTVASAGFRIVRDLAELKNIEEYIQIKDHIKTGMEKEFWKYINRPSNYFKHADKDPEKTFDGIDEKVNEFTILWAIRIYRGLGGQLSVEMRGFLAWFMCLYPDLMTDGSLKALIQTNMNQVNTNNFSRAELLSVGNISVKNMRGSLPT
ncbi:MAG: hypothetical protein CL678_17635 [Bdellovibrionaceae bacterium]|nr:hypothetical protein [Pseudobdellovibrionaceae bacterium]|tara:strand:- start:3951 stop:4505 length:555 start_codon:yes stop_codon:yes gene_type:complete